MICNPLQWYISMNPFFLNNFWWFTKHYREEKPKGGGGEERKRESERHAKTKDKNFSNEICLNLGTYESHEGTADGVWKTFCF